MTVKIVSPDNLERFAQGADEKFAEASHTHPGLIPSGGTEGQVLTKTSNGFDWANPTGGSSGEYLPLSGGTPTGSIYATPAYDSTLPYYGKVAFGTKGKVAKGTMPTEPEYHTMFAAADSSGDLDSNAHKYGQVEVTVPADGSTRLDLQVFKNEAGSTTSTALSVGFDTSGNAYTAAPTPASSDNSTKIATTAFVNNFLPKKLYGYGLPTRQTSANVLFGDGCARIIQATSSMSTGKPTFNGTARDSVILDMAWDNTGGYDVQLAIANTTGEMSVRGGSGSSNWSAWNTVLTSANYNTWAAAKSHGNHVPATQTANNKVFLRNDNTWQTITPANIGAAAASHTHSYLSTSGGTISGSLTVTGTLKGGTIQATSDIRKKSNIVAIDDVDLHSIKAYEYNLEDNKRRSTGLIAQEIEKILPTAVEADEKGFLSLDYNAIVAVLVNKVNALEARISELENK